MAYRWMVDPRNNEVYAFNAYHIKESGFKPYNGPLPKIDPVLGVRILKDGTEEFEAERTVRLQPLIPEDDKTGEDGAVPLDAMSRKDEMIEAFKGMPRIEFLTANGMPKLTAIEKACGFKPTLEEREEAFKEFTARQNAEQTAAINEIKDV